VVDAEEQMIARLVPPGSAFVRRELQDLQIVGVRIPEVEGLDPARVRVPVRQRLGSGRGVLHVVPAQKPVRGVHVADDHRDVLEPLVVAPAVHRRRPTPGRGSRSARFLFAQAQADDAAHAEHAEQVLVRVALDLGLGHHLERQDARIEVSARSMSLTVIPIESTRLIGAARSVSECARREQEQCDQQGSGARKATHRRHLA
jgi:hypothetical protein